MMYCSLAGLDLYYFASVSLELHEVSVFQFNSAQHTSAILNYSFHGMKQDTKDTENKYFNSAGWAHSFPHSSTKPKNELIHINKLVSV